MIPPPAATIISTPTALASLLASIPPFSTLYIDLEGTKLGSPTGALSLITIHLLPSNTTHLIDVLTLGVSAFTTSPTSDPSKTLASMLTDPIYPKCLWDVRADASALWSLYRICLQGIMDIQILENASRQGGSRKFLRGLDKAINPL